MKFKQFQTGRHVTGAGLLIVAVVTLFWPVISAIMLLPRDFTLHNDVAKAMAQTGDVLTSHPLYQFLVIIVHRMLPGDQWIMAANVVTVGFYVILSLVLYTLCSYRWRPSTTLATLACVLMVLALMLVTPVSLFIADGHPYLGYIGISVYHNPTSIVLRPLAVVLFVYVVQAFRPHTKSNRLPVILSALLLSVISTLAKPSYAICLLPALFIWTVVTVIRKRRADWVLLIAGIVIPALAVIAWQAHMLYTPPLVEDSSGVIFAPFKVWAGYSSWLFPKFILSILFPLIVYVMFFKQAKRSLSLNLAWLVFAIGAGYAYLLAESGKRMAAGNFGSSAQIALFILFVFSTLFFVERGLLDSPSNRFRDNVFRKSVLLSAAAFGLHLLSGVIWYLQHALSPGETPY